MPLLTLLCPFVDARPVAPAEKARQVDSTTQAHSWATAIFWDCDNLHNPVHCLVTATQFDAK